MLGANKTITVWNKWRNPSTNKDEWFRHIIPNCSWERQGIRSASGGTASLASTISVLISANEEYKNANDWAAFADKQAFFTLNLGDLVALGGQLVDITGISPFTESAVKQSLMPDAFIIRVASDNSDVYKQGQHYYVEGV